MEIDNKLLLLESLIKIKDTDISYDGFYDRIKDKISWINYTRILNDFAINGIVKEDYHTIITDIGLKEYNKLKQQIENENKLKQLKLDKLESEKELRELDKKLAKSNLETNQITKRNSYISIGVSIFTVIALITQIILSRTNKTIIKEEIKVQGLQELSRNSGIIEKRLDSLLTFHNHLILNNLQEMKKKTTNKASIK